MNFFNCIEALKKFILNKIDSIEFNLEQSTPLFVQLIDYIKKRFEDES